MNKLSIKKGLKFYHTLVLHIPTVESYRKTLSDRSSSTRNESKIALDGRFVTYEFNLI